MNRLLLAALLLVPVVAVADVDPRFSRLRDQAEPLGGLSTFLDKYIGECSDLFAGPTCRSNAEAFRKSYQGKRLYMIVTEDVATMVAPGAYQPRSANYTIHITPFFPAGKYALTHGAPMKTDGQGNPLLPLLTVTGTLPEGWNGMMFSRLFSARGIRVQVVFTPKGVWSMPRKGSGKLLGVNAQIEAILLTEGRTGQTLGLWLHGKDAAKK